MSAKTYIIQVQDSGRLRDNDRMEIANFISQFPGKKLRLEISIYRKRRSDSQNAYYWTVVIPIVTRMLRDFGNEVNEYDAHDYLKSNVMKVTKIMLGADGKPEMMIGSTSGIPMDEWGGKMDIIRSWAASHGTQIPLPGENYGS